MYFRGSPGFSDRAAISLPQRDVSMTTEDSTTVVDINTEDQINMPSVLGLPQDMAREKLERRAAL